MAKISDIKPAKKITQLNIGYPGSGKTVAAGSYPSPILFLDLDLRIDSLPALFPNRDDIEYEQYGPFEFQRFWDRIQKFRAGDTPHKTYVIDSLTALARMIINFSISIRGNKGLKVGNIPMMDVQDFNAETSLLSHTMAIFRSIPANFILNAHLVETTTKDLNNETETVKQRLVTGGKTIAAEIPGYFNERYYIAKKPTAEGYRYFCYTIARNGIDTSTNLPLPGEIEFTMKPGEGGLYQKIKEICKSKGLEII